MNAEREPAADDAIALTRALIRCPSVTPAEGGALDLLQRVLGGLGFACQRLPFREDGTEPVDNLYARLGTQGPNFCFAGHTDVVPPGDPADWSVDPFAGAIDGDTVIGRGAVDMKGAIACFVAAVAALAQRHGRDFGGSISLLITGDEEAEAINGTRKVLGHLARQGEPLDACLVGEPTSDGRLADTVKIGRRGSLNARLTVHGVQGHVAYPQLADNPVHHLVRLLQAVTADALDEGTEHFPPSTLQVTTIDVGNPTTNLIPAVAHAALNVRFNDLHSSETVAAWLRERFDAAIADAAAARYTLETRCNAESFLSEPGALSDAVVAAVRAVTGQAPALATTGGTSDARFIKDACPVAELGLLNARAHKVDEQVSTADLHALTAIYEAVLRRFFAL